MMQRDEVKVRDRAYALWEMAGSPDGRDWEFWHQAERELAEEDDEVDVSERSATIAMPPPLPGGMPH